MKYSDYKQLIIDNHNLIYVILNEYRLSLDSVEDYYGICALLPGIIAPDMFQIRR